jgi:hypothetical protein
LNLLISRRTPPALLKVLASSVASRRDILRRSLAVRPTISDATETASSKLISSSRARPDARNCATSLSVVRSITPR